LEEEEIVVVVVVVDESGERLMRLLANKVSV